jgi:ATP-binding cassette subfamily B protein
MTREILSAKLRKVLAQLPYLPRTLGLMWKVAKGWTIAWVMLLAIEGLLPVASVYLTKLVVDGVAGAFRTAGSFANVRGVLILVIALAAVMLLTEMLRGIISWISAFQAELLQEHISELIHEKSVSVDLAFYEFPDYYDQLHRAKSEARFRPVALIENLGMLMQNSLTILAMGAILIPLGPWLSVALLLSSLPAFLVVLRFALIQYEVNQRTTPDERKSDYFDWLLTASDVAPELRLFDLGYSFKLTYQQLRRSLRKERLQLLRHRTIAQLAANLVALFLAGGAMLYMVWRAMMGLITLGDLALIYAAFNQGQRLMRSLLENLGQLYANCLFLGGLFEFLALPATITDPAPGSAKTIESVKQQIQFKNVSFSYPTSKRKALDEFNLTISAGTIVAIVGPNGAGKSTLIKLLCRFYDPEGGQIEIDGVGLKELTTQDLRRLMTVLFQQPVQYNATVRDNVEYGNLTGTQSTQVETAVSAAGAEEIVARLPQRYESVLGNSFSEGTELSVGEWQRIALSRAFFRDAPIIILDEPTSALDPWAEADWLARFRKLARGRTAIVITHRFTTAMHADVIHVMEKGRVVESGDHSNLLKAEGRYAESWSKQINAASQA